MAITNADLLVVQQGNSVYKVEFGTVKTDIVNGVPRQEVSYISENQPPSAIKGDLWFKPSNGFLYIYSDPQWDMVKTDTDLDSLPELP